MSEGCSLYRHFDADGTLPPTPARVGEYFRRRRSTLVEFTEADLEANERLWRAICGGPGETVGTTLFDPAPKADVSDPENVEGMTSQGGSLTALQHRSPQEITAPERARRTHRQTRRSTGVCETCGTEFEQPRGPSSKFCSTCREIARRQAARAHMRLIRGGLAEATACAS
jgi:hypothetical protein